MTQERSAIAQKLENMKFFKTESEIASASRKSSFFATAEDLATEQFLSWFPKAPKLRVLECGCGTGFLLRKLSERYGEVTGLDISSDSLELIDMSTDSLQGLVCGDGSNLPFTDGSFDIVVFGATLHHIPDRDGALSETRRVLASKGIVLVSEPCVSNWLLRLLYGILSKEHFFSPAELRKLLLQNGVEAVFERRVGYLGFFFRKVMYRHMLKLAVHCGSWLAGASFKIDSVLQDAAFLNRFHLGVVVVCRKIAAGKGGSA
jgi:SAM-dependent methyltransferase